MSSQIATFATIFFSMILVNNYVLVKFKSEAKRS